jgi:hypothetical protein
MKSWRIANRGCAGNHREKQVSGSWGHRLTG